jgi:hypothetical protein
MQTILIEREDGGVSVMRLLDGAVNIRDEVAKWQAVSPWKAVRWRKVAADDIPADRTWRDAWRAQEGKIAVDRGAAEAVHMNRIRAARNRELERLDKEIAKAEDSDGKPATALRAERQRLRDIPQTFDLSRAGSLDDLKAIWPEGLPRP